MDAAVALPLLLGPRRGSAAAAAAAALLIRASSEGAAGRRQARAERQQAPPPATATATCGQRGAEAPRGGLGSPRTERAARLAQPSYRSIATLVEAHMYRGPRRPHAQVRGHLPPLGSKLASSASAPQLGSAAEPGGSEVPHRPAAVCGRGPLAGRQPRAPRPPPADGSAFKAPSQACHVVDASRAMASNEGRDALDGIALGGSVEHVAENSAADHGCVRGDARPASVGLGVAAPIAADEAKEAEAPRPPRAVDAEAPSAEAPEARDAVAAAAAGEDAASESEASGSPSRLRSMCEDTASDSRSPDRAARRRSTTLVELPKNVMPADRRRRLTVCESEASNRSESAPPSRGSSTCPSHVGGHHGGSPPSDKMWHYLEDRFGTLREAFKAMDRNGNGVLSSGELMEALVKFDVPWAEITGLKSYHALFKALCPDKLGLLNIKTAVRHDGLPFEPREDEWQFLNTMEKWSKWCDQTGDEVPQRLRPPPWQSEDAAHAKRLLEEKRDRDHRRMRRMIEQGLHKTKAGLQCVAWHLPKDLDMEMVQRYRRDALDTVEKKSRRIREVLAHAARQRHDLQHCVQALQGVETRREAKEIFFQQRQAQQRQNAAKQQVTIDPELATGVHGQVRRSSILLA